MGFKHKQPDSNNSNLNMEDIAQKCHKYNHIMIIYYTITREIWDLFHW